MDNKIKKCIICGKNIPERRLKDNKKTCCKRCQMLTPESKKKRSEIMKNVQSKEETKKKISEALKLKWQDENYKNNCINGRAYLIDSIEYKNKLSSSLKKYHSSERHQEFVKAMNNPETKEKMSKAQKARFADKDKNIQFRKAMNKPKTIEKLRQIMMTDEIQQKIHNTKKKNHSFNTSQPEQYIKQLLEQKFNKVHYQYRSELYPFNCDFYVEDLDLYIECHFGWLHGSKPYNKNDEECQKLLDHWQSKTSQYYKNAIYTWTDLDVRKLQTFKKNNLNYKIFYNLDEFNSWFIKN